MPLIASSSNAARSANIGRELDAGKPRAQAIAIGYAVQRRARGAPGRAPGRRRRASSFAQLMQE